MKKIIICVMLLIIASATFSQQSNPSSTTLTKQDYLQKSKHQKTAAWIFMGAGVLSAGVLGGVKVNPEIGGADNSGSTIFLVVGLVAVGASIPLFIAASKNKKKGMSISFKNEPAPYLENSSFIKWPVPSLSLKLGL